MQRHKQETARKETKDQVPHCRASIIWAHVAGPDAAASPPSGRRWPTRSQTTLFLLIRSCAICAVQP